MLAKAAPSPKDLENTVNRTSLHATKRGRTARRIREKASEIHQFQMKNKRARTADAMEWTNGGHGWIAETKPSGCTRITLENVNSLKHWTEGNHNRILQIDDTRKRLQTDLLTIVKPQVDWNQVEP